MLMNEAGRSAEKPSGPPKLAHAAGRTLTGSRSLLSRFWSPESNRAERLRTFVPCRSDTIPTPVGPSGVSSDKKS